MNLLDETLLRIKSNAAIETATARLFEPEIKKFEEIACWIKGCGYCCTPSVTATGYRIFCFIHITASPKRIADLLLLLEKRGITATRDGNDHQPVWDALYELNAWDSLTIKLACKTPAHPKQAARTPERKVA